MARAAIARGAALRRLPDCCVLSPSMSLHPTTALLADRRGSPFGRDIRTWSVCSLRQVMRATTAPNVSPFFTITTPLHAVPWRMTA